MTNGRSLCHRDRPLDHWYDYRDLHFTLYPFRGRLAGRGYVLEVVDRHGRLVRRRVAVTAAGGGLHLLTVRQAVAGLRRGVRSGRAG